MSYGFGIVIESLVAILLLLTIGYCVVLNRRLQRLRTDEEMLKATISELITATEIAERAVAGLKLTAQECDKSLGERLRAAEAFAGELDRQVRAGADVLDRLSRIVVAARPPQESAISGGRDPKAMVAVAHAIAERARGMAGGLAA